MEREGREKLMKPHIAMKSNGEAILVLGLLLFIPSLVCAQLTNGKKPQLPPPFATKSAGNPPEETKPPQGFLPTAPAGFRVNVFAGDLNEPGWWAGAPNGEFFLRA